MESDLGESIASPHTNSEHQNNELKPQDTECGPTETNLLVSGIEVMDSSGKDGEPKANKGRRDVWQSSTKKPSRSACKEKVPAKLKNRRYPLRSSFSSVRVLRSMSNKVNKTAAQPAPVPTTSPVKCSKGKIKRRNVKGEVNDEFSRIRKRARYLLTRMKYEQNLLDAYSSEGWKGQSLEKIRPEQELQRAKSEIIRCKLKFRDLFQHLDSLISEGRLDDSLFDSDGQIDSEDIVCTKCGLKDASLNNDIILCDGICDRAFHQKCLTPPLLNEDIPLGDEGWLCPGCDCKLDCIDFINELQGTDLSVEDEWEKVFPEAAAIASGDKQYDDLALPLDDSEDDDYAPDGLQVDEQDDEGSSSEESFTSEDSVAPHNDMPSENLGLPSDDSKDDDYDPSKPDIDVKSQKSGSSDESDFTSDSSESDAPSSGSGPKENFASPKTNHSGSHVQSGKGRSARDRNKVSVNTELLSLVEPDMGQENFLVSGKRERERLDYKRLYDDTYGNRSSSDSSDDEEWTDKITAKKVKSDAKGICTSTVSSANTRNTKNLKNSKSVKGKLTGDQALPNLKLDQSKHVSKISTDNTKRKARDKLKSGVRNHSVDEQYDSPEKPSPEVSAYSSKKRNRGKITNTIAIDYLSPQQKNSLHPDSDGKKTPTSSQRFFSKEVSMRLHQSFKENQYPSRDTKETLAEGLGITLQQVDKWFGNARHSFRVSANQASKSGNSPGNGNIVTPPSRKGIKSGKRTTQKSPSSGAQEDSQNDAANTMASAAENGTRGEEDNRESAVENSARQKLVLRELRKRRMVK